MTAGTLAPTARPRLRRRGVPVPPLSRFAAVRSVRSGALWGAVFGLVVASSAASYASLYRTQAARERLAVMFGANHATSALFGPAPQLDTVAGFTVFKSFLTLSIIGAVWGLLQGTALLRGEEEAGRWELLLAGPTTRSRATAQVLSGLAAGVATLWLVTAAVVAVAGRSASIGIAAGPALFFALALCGDAAVFAAVGAVTSQLAATRRQAAGYALTVLGISYALRLLADAGTGLHALIWVTPLGWVEQLQPLTAPRLLPLLPIVVATLALAALAVVLAGRRDLGASILPDRASARPRLRWLAGPLGLAARLLRPSVLGWWVAVGVTGLLLGLVAQAAGATLSGTSVQDVFTRLGAPGGGTGAYLGVAFLIVTVLVTCAAAGHLTALRAEEADGHLDALLAAPVSRWRWLAGRLAVAVVAVVLAGLAAATATWLGTVGSGSAVDAPAVLGAGLNSVAPAVCLLGVGTLAWGLRPRATSAVVYGIVGWSLLVQVVGGIGAVNHWLLDVSLFHDIAAAPAVSPDWTSVTVLVLVGAGAAAAGAVAFRRRDLAPD